MSDEALVSLATNEIAPATMLIDGQEYHLYDVRHLSDSDEIKLNSMLTRDFRWGRRAAKLREEAGNCETDEDAENKLTEAEHVSKQILDQRVDLIELMTDCPANVINKLKSYDKQRVINAVMTLIRRLNEKDNPKSDEEQTEEAAPEASGEQFS